MQIAYQAPYRHTFTIQPACRFEYFVPCICISCIAFWFALFSTKIFLFLLLSTIEDKTSVCDKTFLKWTLYTERFFPVSIMILMRFTIYITYPLLTADLHMYASNEPEASWICFCLFFVLVLGFTNVHNFVLLSNDRGVPRWLVFALQVTVEYVSFFLFSTCHKLQRTAVAHLAVSPFPRHSLIVCYGPFYFSYFGVICSSLLKCTFSVLFVSCNRLCLI